MDSLSRRADAAAMDSFSHHADDAITELLRQCKQIAHPAALLRVTVERFEFQWRCLRIFVQCIQRWTDLQDVLQRASLVRKIEAKVQEMENKIIQNIDLPLVRPPRQHHLALKILSKISDKITRHRKIHKLYDLFIELSFLLLVPLKKEISEAYDSWSTQSFEFSFDYDRWEEFSEFIDYYLGASSKCYFKKDSESTLMKQFEVLNRYLDPVKGFIDCLPESSSNDLKIKVMIEVGRVAITAALQLCEWWPVGLPANKKNVRFNLLELQHKIDFTSPEFLYFNLKLLSDQNGNRIQNQVSKFLKCFFPLTKGFARYLYLKEPHTLHGELKSLVISVVTLPREDEENVQRLFADVRRVLTSVAKEAQSYHYASTDTVTDINMLRGMLTEIWFVKLESFLRVQLNTCDILQKEKIHYLSKGLTDLNYEEWLKSLETTIKHSSNTEEVKSVLALMEEISTSLDHSFDAQEMTITIETVRNLLLKLLIMVMLFKADRLVRDFLYDNDQILVVLDKYQTEALHKGLEFLIMFVKDHPAGTVEEAKLVFEHIEEVSSGVCSLFISLPTSNGEEEACKDMDSLVSDLLEKIRPIMVELKVFLHAPNFPKLGFIDPFLEKLRELLKDDVATSLKHQIGEIFGELEFLAPFLEDILEQEFEFQGLKDLRARIVEVVYNAEYYIDSLMLEDSVEWHNSLRLYHLQEDIRLLKEHLPTTCEKVHHAKEQDMPQIPVQKKEPKATTSRIDETLVILKDQQEIIIDRLIAGPEQLDIVPIVGLPGIGKTTLARQLYNRPEVESHFHVRTWSHISQIYSKRKMLLDMLSSITALSDDILGMRDEDLEDKLRKHLLKRKFLIVMDDLWNTEVLNDLRGSFPNDGNGSRILITSRRNLKANSYADPHHLRQLSDAESWSLLQKKIFREVCCPKELIEIGEEIAKTCKGLPLAVVAVAGILLKREKECNSWKEISKDLSFLIVDDPQEQCRQIIELSYNNLPDYLKACFLYFGAFLEDQDIPARKLMQLWIAEGLVRKTGFKSLEDLAEDYLSDLIDRSLVIFSQQRSRGGVKTCRVHDVLQKFCQSKAKEDKFLTVITESTESYAPLRDFEYVFSAKLDNPSSSTTYKDHRLCFCTQRKHLAESRSSGPCTRSLLCFASNDKDSKCPYEISFISQNFRLLKVLDLGCINVGTSFPKGIEQMVHLRYLALAGYIDYIPPSIAKLWNLEILIVRGLKDDRVIYLPDAIWCLKKLRHVHISPFAVISSQDDQHGNSSGFSYLVTFSSLFLRFEKGTEFILMKISNLRKLKCIFLESWDNSQNCNNFPRMDVLNQLESLKISYYGRALHPGEFSFPSKLKKLTLSNFHLPWDKISVIGKLRYLEVLKLLSGAFDGENWDMVEGEFLELKYLKLDMLNISKWNACSDHLPKLEQLFLRRCNQLEEVPLHIADIPTLEMIDVQWCGYLVEESARQIKEEGDENLKVFINFSELHIS